jgi:hypothetical protein
MVSWVPWMPFLDRALVLALCPVAEHKELASWVSWLRRRRRLRVVWEWQMPLLPYALLLLPLPLLVVSWDRSPSLGNPLRLRSAAG